jgi:hypothetical protein
MRRWLGLDEPQETRFFLVIAAWALGSGIVYWIVSQEPAGTALLLGLGIACGAMVARLVLVRRAADVRRRASADAQHAEGVHPGRVDASGGGTGGIDRPFQDRRWLVPDPTLAPFAVGLGLALISTGAIFGIATVLVGALPLAWGGWTWLTSAREEYRSVIELEAAGIEPGGEESDDRRLTGPRPSLSDAGQGTVVPGQPLAAPASRRGRATADHRW